MARLSRFVHTINTMNTINIYTYGKIRKRISENTITLFLIIIYISLILGYAGYFRYYKPRNLDRARLWGAYPTYTMHTHTTNIGYFPGKKAGAADNKHNEKSDNLAQ